MSEVGSGVPAPGKPKSTGERLGSLAALILVLVVLAFVAGFTSDLVVWGWDLGRSIIH